ncbi:MAG: PIN domain-containing protein [Chloroflexi bacterium]|nr:PIN domain-containing protein [Chloroflexota bacterium]
MGRPPDVTPTAYADTNLLLAYLAGASHPFHAAAMAVMRRVDIGELRLIIEPLVVAETSWAARSALGRSAASVAPVLLGLIEADGLVVTDRAVIRRALEVQIERPALDFVDAWLVAKGLLVGPPVIVTFDRDLDRVPGIERLMEVTA